MYTIVINSQDHKIKIPMAKFPEVLTPLKLFPWLLFRL